MSIGTYTLHKTGTDTETPFFLEFNFTPRHEIVAGQTLTGSATIRVLDSTGAVSTVFTLVSAVLDSTSTKVQVSLTDVSSVIDHKYTVTCLISLSGGKPLLEAIDVQVEAP